MKLRKTHHRASAHRMHARNLSWFLRTLHASMLLLGMVLLGGTFGCGTAKEKEQQNEFFTSGSREADQRASQRMAKSEQLAGSGEGAGEKEKKGEEKANGSDASTVEEKRALYERLGGAEGVAAIVDDFMTRVLADPRVNWERKGMKRGGFSFSRNQSIEWSASEQNVARVKKHMAQFFALATGGPARYDGKDMRSAHANLQITNAEFDAAVGDLKASLDKLKIANREQKELLAIVESTRPQVVSER